MTTLLNRATLIAILFSIALVACRKNDKPAPPEPPKPEPPAPVAIPSVNDSMYFLFKDQYLWNDVIPDSATFKPNSYAKTEDMFDALTRFKKQNGKNMDKYSFLDDGTVAEEIGGISGGFGMNVSYNELNDLRVVSVYPGSPAYQQGIRRAWRIIAINGDANLTYDGDQVKGPGTTIARIVKAIYQSEQTSLTLQKPDGSSDTTVTVNAAKFEINPVLYSNILNLSGRKVGYFVFNQFIDLTKAQPYIDPVFDNFIAKGITDLIVDLRYNGGGSAETTEYLANLIAPVSVGTNGQNLMYKEHFNAQMTNHQYSNYLRTRLIPGYTNSWSDLFDLWVAYASTYFSKKKTLNLANIAFIGTGQTASASELLINVLRPYMGVKLVGDTTYGKPVGFVTGMHIGKFDMYAISIWAKNKDNYGDYFDGMIPDDAAAVAGKDERFEDLSKEWGSTDEVYLRRALNVLGIPQPALLRSRMAIAGPGSSKLMFRNSIPDMHFKGMVGTRKKSRY
ncbi:S41 family peptidase [Niabella drilacis]|uniref:Peptidase family S41 n=1 Tax=Niabella drilacis (strain DSM 25811 / CCM 8410 / CCUG 62505 / LMG 26954 / E90) TaxID=1285928 RepID=A0A1G6PQ21_NIADE|nr:S41 family peptidase [Niabella drilacis]SDC82159.1 Peptidase family S41 [Niabella drilacis]